MAKMKSKVVTKRWDVVDHLNINADRAEYLLYEGLYASATLPIKAAARPGFADLCLTHFANTWPIGQWLLDEVAGG